MSGTSTHIALLRGINVGGRNRLPMAQLKQLFDAAGCAAVRTYIQSGNVVFEAPTALARRLANELPRALAREAQIQVPVIVRTATELARVVSNNPFLASGADPTQLHVGFLAKRPAPDRRAALDPDRSPPDTCALVGRELFLQCPNGMARTKLTTAYFDATLGTTTTIRNWRTTLALLEMAGG